MPATGPPFSFGASRSSLRNLGSRNGVQKVASVKAALGFVYGLTAGQARSGPALPRIKNEGSP